MLETIAAISEHKHNNAFISVDRDGALQAAKKLDIRQSETDNTVGPLHGIPIAVKDNIHVAGMRNTAGTSSLNDFVPTLDATVIARLKNAGAVIVGKTNMHELAFGITSNNGAFGAVKNALNPKYFAGGSSGGTAVAIASGAVTMGIGTDTGGSCRIPAALNGVVGFRPTTGRYPADGLTTVSSTRDTAGPMARSVADVIILDRVLSNENDQSPSVVLSDLRFGIPRGYFYDDLQDEVRTETERLLVALSDAGATLVETDLQQSGQDIGQLNEKAAFPIIVYETNQLLRAYLQQNAPAHTLESLVANIKSPDVRALFDLIISEPISHTAYTEAVEIHRPNLQQAYYDYFAEHRVDAILFPTTPLTARPIENCIETVELNGNQVPTFPTYIRNTDPSSNAGVPCLTIPLAKCNNGLPFGIEINGPANTDHKVLAIGLALEALIDN